MIAGIMEKSGASGSVWLAIGYLLSSTPCGAIGFASSPPVKQSRTSGADTMKKATKRPPPAPEHDEHDWSRLDAMTEAEKHAAAVSDPDNPPLTEEDMRRMKQTPRAKVIRRALGLTQEEFAARYRIPVGTLRDWEEGRAEPDEAARAYLLVIAREPEMVRKALEPRPLSKSAA